MACWNIGFKDVESELWTLKYSAIPDLAAAKMVVEERGLFRELYFAKPSEMKIDPAVHIWSEQDRILKEAYPDLMLKLKEQFGRLFKVSLFLSADEKFVGMVLSISHYIADGYTFYKLYEALLSDKDFSLKVERNMDTMSEQVKVFGEDETNLLEAFGFVLPIICSIVLDKLLGWLWPNRFSVVSKTYVLDQNKLSKLKKQTKLPFISTNDIVTSWFLSKVTFGAMFMNLRGRVPGHNDDMAGNYEGIAHYRSVDVATPDLIRQSLKKCRRIITPDQSMAGREALRAWRSHMITSWASLYPKSVDTLGIYKTHSHGPIGRIASPFPSNNLFCVVYQSSPSQLSMMITASPNAHKTIDTSTIAMIEDDLVVSKDKEL